MPPKRQFNDESDEDERTSSDESTEEESDDDQPQQRGGAATTTNAVDTSAGGQFISNNPNDEAFEVEDDDVKKTPPQGSLNGSTGANPHTTISGASAGAPNAGNTLSNNPNDEAFEVDDSRHIPTPGKDGPTAAQGRVNQQQQNNANANESRVIKNDKHDEFSDVEDDDDEEADTPPRQQPKQKQPNQAGNQQQQGGAQFIANDHHDEAMEIDGSSAATTPERHNAGQAQQQQQQQQQQNTHTRTTAPAHGQIRPDDDDEEEDEDEEVETSDDDDDAGKGPRMGDIAAAASAAAAEATGSGLEYNPAEYEYLRKKVPSEVYDLFALIGQFQAAEMDLPAKFRPFVPEFIPCVGDIDAFCKVPRPDGVPDGMGLNVIDEPSTHQSNPAVVKMNLEYGSKVAVRSVHVQSVADAATRPALIDRWVAEIRDTHAKKPLPSVNYSKPMPEIDELLQIWPPEFEELLSSDLQFPPPQIDLDIEQYCRVMCTMLDIPIYDNIIESLHVMFTLFLEFRANQHFQHN